MYNHPTTQANIIRLRSFGNTLIAPREGELASGLSGFGRMEEPEKIITILQDHFSRSESMEGKKVLITSGTTIEPIDPVRFISNNSSGLMGNALALESAKRGAKVILVSGPVNNLPVHPNIEVVKVSTAAQMHETCIKRFPESELCIMAAAVADYIPENPSVNKIKKEDELLTLRLKKSVDILSELGNKKRPGQLLAGFALETENEIENARTKLHTKNLDFIVLNSLKDAGAGFGMNTNQVTIIDKNGELHPFGLKPKSQVAEDILDYACKLVV